MALHSYYTLHKKCYQKIRTGIRKHAFPIKTFTMQQEFQQTELMWFPMLIKTINCLKKKACIVQSGPQTIKNPTNYNTQHLKQLCTYHWTSVGAQWHQHCFLQYLPDCDGSILPSKKWLGMTLLSLKEKKIKSWMEWGVSAWDKTATKSFLCQPVVTHILFSGCVSERLQSKIKPEG